MIRLDSFMAFDTLLVIEKGCKIVRLHLNWREGSIGVESFLIALLIALRSKMLMESLASLGEHVP